MFFMTAMTLMISNNANAQDKFNNVEMLEQNSPSSGKVAPGDFDTFYRIPLSATENIDFQGNLDFESEQFNSNQHNASFLLKYSMNF